MPTWNTIYFGGSEYSQFTLKNKFIHLIKLNPYLVIAIILLLLICLSFIFAFFTDFQDKLPSLSIELIGVLLTLLIIESFILGITKKGSYKATKFYLYKKLDFSIVRLTQDAFEHALGILSTAHVLSGDETKSSITSKMGDDSYIEGKYCQLTDNDVSTWKNKNKENLYHIEEFLKYSPIITPKDSFLRDIIILKELIVFINDELGKPQNIRIQNKGFMRQYLKRLAGFIVAYIDCGLYLKLYSSNDYFQLIKLTE